MKVRTQARREAIVEAATLLFKEVGYERASMNELTKRMGGSKATLYGYFPSKEALFSEVVRTVAIVHLSEAVSQLAEESPAQFSLEQSLTRFGERMLHVLTDDADARAVYRMVVGEAGRSDIGMLFYNSGPGEYLAILARWMADAMARGELREAEPKVRALQFLALLTAEVDDRVFQVDPPPLNVEQVKTLVRNATQLFLLGAGKPRPD